MTGKKTTMLAAAALLAVAGCRDTLDAGEMRETLVGNTLRGIESGENNVYWVYFETEERLHMRVEATDFADLGRWRVDADDRYCATWTMVREGAEACFPIERDGDTLFFMQGETAIEMTLLDGNPQRLP